MMMPSETVSTGKVSATSKQWIFNLASGGMVGVLVIAGVEEGGIGVEVKWPSGVGVSITLVGVETILSEPLQPINRAVRVKVVRREMLNFFIELFFPRDRAIYTGLR
jgi:hypothetical protein